MNECRLQIDILIAGCSPYWYKPKKYQTSPRSVRKIWICISHYIQTAASKQFPNFSGSVHKRLFVIHTSAAIDWQRGLLHVVIRGPRYSKFHHLECCWLPWHGKRDSREPQSSNCHSREAAPITSAHTSLANTATWPRLFKGVSRSKAFHILRKEKRTE